MRSVRRIYAIITTHIKRKLDQNRFGIESFSINETLATEAVIKVVGTLYVHKKKTSQHIIYNNNIRPRRLEMEYNNITFIR